MYKVVVVWPTRTDPKYVKTEEEAKDMVRIAKQSGAKDASYVSIDS